MIDEKFLIELSDFIKNYDLNESRESLLCQIFCLQRSFDKKCDEVDDLIKQIEGK